MREREGEQTTAHTHTRDATAFDSFSAIREADEADLHERPTQVLSWQSRLAVLKHHVVILYHVTDVLVKI